MSLLDHLLTIFFKNSVIIPYNYDYSISTSSTTHFFYIQSFLFCQTFSKKPMWIMSDNLFNFTASCSVGHILSTKNIYVKHTSFSFSINSTTV